MTYAINTVEILNFAYLSTIFAYNNYLFKTISHTKMQNIKEKLKLPKKVN